MRTSFSLFFVSFLALYCAAQQTPTDHCLHTILEGGPDMTTVEQLHTTAKQLQSELNSENGPIYASVFGPGATWDGPLGQNALGPENIKRAAGLMFQTVGPLQCVLWLQRKLSADTWLVDMYQKVTNAHNASRKSIPIAPGSAPPSPDEDIRTTLVLRGTNTGLRVVAARVADLRLLKSNHPISASISQ